MRGWLLVVMLLGCMASPALSAGAPEGDAAVTTRNVTVDFKGVPLRQAVEQLFRGTGETYAIEREVADVPVTLSMQDVPLLVALRTLTRLADTTFRREGQRYVIGRRNPVPAGSKVNLKLKDVRLRDALMQLFEGTGREFAIGPEVPNPPLTLVLQDQDFTTALRQLLRSAGVGATYQRMGNMYLIGLRPRGAPNPEAIKVTLELKATPFRKALEQLFQSTGLRCAVELGVPDPPIRMSLRDEPLDLALQRLVEQAGAAYRQEGDFFIIEKRASGPPQK